MKRLIAMLFVALAGALFNHVGAQPAERPARIGVLSPGSPPPGPLEAFRSGLRELGYVEGRNVRYEWRFADGRNERLPVLLQEIVKSGVDVLFVINTQAALAAKSGAGTIPVVFARVSDPTRTGLVASLSHPGGNLTGISNVADELGAKRIEMLKSVLPHVQRVAVLWNSGNPGLGLILKEAQAAAPRLGIEVTEARMRTAADLASAFEAIRASRAQALFVLDDLLVTSYKAQILAHAHEARIPVMSLYEEFVESGGLMSYGPSIEEMYRRAGWYVDRILRGAKAGELPVEQPANFRLVVSLKAANELGLSIPRDVLVRVDKVVR